MCLVSLKLALYEHVDAFVKYRPMEPRRVTNLRDLCADLRYVLLDLPDTAAA